MYFVILQECMAKEREEKKGPPLTIEGQDDIPLFYSDLMPLLVSRYILYDVGIIRGPGCNS